MTDDQLKPDQNKEDSETAMQMMGLFAGLGVALGAGVGTAIGVAFNNIAMGVSLGAGVGVALGIVMCLLIVQLKK